MKTDFEKVHWYEGLFLQPHHLQQMQRSTDLAVVAERQLRMAYPYGVMCAELSEDALENHLVQFTKLHAIMPSGVRVCVPEATSLPALNIKQAFESRREPMTVYLAVPAWSPNDANAVLETDENAMQTKCLYRVAERSCSDENTGENAQPVMVRQVNARLVLDSDDLSHLELLPLLRVVPSSSEEGPGLPQWDRHYVPPCLQLGGARYLQQSLDDLVNQMLSCRNELVVQINRSGYNAETLSGVQLERVLRLRTLNQYAARLGGFLSVDTVSPFAAYLELRGLLGELAALQPGRDLFDVPPYNHEDCRPVFVELFTRIRNLMLPEGAGSYLKLMFARREDGPGWAVELTDEHIVKAEDYFLAVRCRENPQQVAQLVEDGNQFKLIAASMAGGRVRGIRLSEERYPPQILPAMANVLWFRLRRADSARSWSQVRDEKRMVAIWPEAILPEVELSLYITLYETGEA